MWDWISTLSRLQQQSIPFALVTIIDDTGSTPRNIGAKMVVVEGGEFYGTVGGGNLEKMVLEAAVECLEQGQSKMVSISLGAQAGQCCGGVVDLFIEVHGRRPTVFIFGAGHVGQALAQVLIGTPFVVQLIDQRSDWPKEIIGPEIKIIKENPLEIIKNLNFNQNLSYVVILTHSHDLDFQLLSSILDFPTKYVGVIGSLTKWHRFKKRLMEFGHDQAKWEKVKCPIGITIGGKSPKEVAISIAAELLSVCNDKQLKE